MLEIDAITKTIALLDHDSAAVQKSAASCLASIAGDGTSLRLLILLILKLVYRLHTSCHR